MGLSDMFHPPWIPNAPSERLKRAIRHPDVRTMTGAPLIVDLKRWMAEGITDRMFRLMKQYPETLSHLDMSLMNFYFQGRFDHLEEKWNLLMPGVPPSRRQIKDAIILHWPGK